MIYKGRLFMDIVVMYKEGGVVPLVVTQAHVDTMKKHVDNVHWFANEDELLASGVDAEIIFCFAGVGTPPERWCLQSKRLKWLNTFSAGVDPLVRSKISDLPIIVTNGKGVHSRSMGLTALGYCVAHLRKFWDMKENQRNRVWKKPPVMGDEAVGKTLGIVGAGSIGQATAEFAKGIGFKVIGVKRKVTPLEYFDEVISDKEMDRALGMMDFVIVLTPLTEQTRHLINADRFAAMKKGAYFINQARGGVVDTNALIDALHSGHLSGAALDTVEPEPLNEDSPLWDMPNVFITPHYSADSPLLVDRAVEQFCQNIESFKAGKPMFNLVDLKNM